MHNVEVLQPGIFTSIQDEGRIGFAYYAIPKSGCLNNELAQITNILVGNPLHYPLIETMLIPCALKFLSNTVIAITGDNFNFTINNKPIPLYESIFIQKGDVLKGQAQKNSFISYIAIKGKIKARTHYGSCSTYSPLGGITGNAFMKGDVFSVEENDTISIRHSMTTSNTPSPIFKIHKGPEYDFLDDASKLSLVNSTYSISPSSDRMGARLSGHKLQSSLYALKNSVPVLPGFIQLPPSGQPIVILKDGQTTGGYPRIGYLVAEDFERFCGIRGEVRFEF